MAQLHSFAHWKSALVVAFLLTGATATAQTPQPSAPREGVPTLSGYMEIHLNKEQDLPTEADLHRFVLMGGHRFTDRLMFWSEIVVEHAFVDGAEERGEEEHHRQRRVAEHGHVGRAQPAQRRDR